jgi:hypothetical protein
MTYKLITCFFCFEEFEVSLEVDSSFAGNNTEIYDCEICCNPNKLDYEALMAKFQSPMLVMETNEFLFKTLPGRTLIKP